MSPEHFWPGGMWIFPLIFLGIFILFLFLCFGRGGFRPPWQDSSRCQGNDSRENDTALEILRKRYAKGEITKEEFDQMRNDLSG